MNTKTKTSLKRNRKRKPKGWVSYKVPVKFTARFESELRKMVRFIRKTYEQEVLDGLENKTVTQFRDGITDDNWVVDIKARQALAIKLINSKYGKARLHQIAKRIINQLNSMSLSNLSRKKKLGLPANELLNRGVDGVADLSIEKIANEILNLKSDTITGYYQNTLRMATQGHNITEMHTALVEGTPKFISKASLIARNELKTFNAVVNVARARNVGIEKRIWQAVGGNRTRPCHQSRDGKEYPIDKGLYDSCDGKTISTGEEINCRCVDRFLI